MIPTIFLIYRRKNSEFTFFKINKVEALLVPSVFLFYIFGILYFTNIPRLLSVDGAVYISIIRTGILENTINPYGIAVPPTRGNIYGLINGRFFWSYLLTSFVASTGIPAFNSGLIGMPFLIMISFTSYELFNTLTRRKNLVLPLFLVMLILTNPLLLPFATMCLNDLIITFYTLFSLTFLVKSFSEQNKQLSFNTFNFLLAIIALIILLLTKVFLLISLSMWITSIYFMLRYRAYCSLRKKELLFFILFIVLPIIYEVFIDLPFTLEVLKSPEGIMLAPTFTDQSLMYFSVKLFIKPVWEIAISNPSSLNNIIYIERFYEIFSPELTNILVSGLVVTSPLIVLLTDLKNHLNIKIFSLFLLVLITVFFLQSIFFLATYQINRYSLWRIPLFYILSLIVLNQLIHESYGRKKRIIIGGAVCLSMLIFVWVNMYLSSIGGIAMSYSGSVIYVDTFYPILSQFLLFSLLVLFLIVHQKTRYRHLTHRYRKRLTLKGWVPKILFFLIILSVISNIYFTSTFMNKDTHFFKEHYIMHMSNILYQLTNDKSIVVANNRLYLTAFVDDGLLKNGLLLNFPSTKEEFLRSIELLPSNTILLITTDGALSWYGDANRNYIKSYAVADIITPATNISKLPLFNCTDDAVLCMTFDDANMTLVPNHGRGPDGLNGGAEVVQGYYGLSLYFKNNSYVEILGGNYTFGKCITISLLTFIKEENINGYHLLLNCTSEDCSFEIFSVFINDGKLYFRIHGTNCIFVPIKEYVGKWHHFIFSYNENRLEIFIDGALIAVKGIEKGVEYCFHPHLWLGSKSNSFIGKIDELEVSNKKLNLTRLLEAYHFNQYALKVYELLTPYGKTSFFKILTTGKNNNPEEKVYFKILTKFISGKDLSPVILAIAYTTTSKNLSFCITSDFASKIYSFSLEKDMLSIVNFTLPPPVLLARSWNDQKYLWRFFTSSKVALFDNNNILFKENISMLNLDLVALAIVGILSILLFVAIISCKKCIEYNSKKIFTKTFLSIT